MGKRAHSLPSMIRVGPIRYWVQLVRDLHDEANRDKLDGHIAYKEGTIKIEAKGSDQQYRVVAWHEVLHGIAQERLPTQPSEEVIDAFAYGVMQALQDNPWLRQDG